jgi:hypothetical protein
MYELNNERTCNLNCLFLVALLDEQICFENMSMYFRNENKLNAQFFLLFVIVICYCIQLVFISEIDFNARR